ncbi:MAG: hypothetical protein WBM32_04330 [Crocosphaera sp.]
MNCRKLLINLGIGTLIALPMILISTTVAKAEQKQLTIHNHTGTDIDELYISSDNNRYWGTERLGESNELYLRPGDSVTITLENPSFEGANCLYDIMARDFDGKEVPDGGFGEFNVCEYHDVALTPTTISPVVYTVELGH